MIAEALVEVALQRLTLVSQSGLSVFTQYREVWCPLHRVRADQGGPMNARNERARCRSVSELMTVNVRYKLPDGSQSTHRGHERVLKRFTFYRLARSSVNPERATNAAGPQSIDLQDEN